MSGIDEYDWSNIFDGAPIDREYTSVVYEWNSGDIEDEFCGVIQNDITGNYYSFSAWHDYTGWDCRSGVEWFGPFASVMGAVGSLTQAERRHLGFDHTPEHKDLFRE